MYVSETLEICYAYKIKILLRMGLYLFVRDEWMRIRSSLMLALAPPTHLKNMKTVISINNNFSFISQKVTRLATIYI